MLRLFRVGDNLAAAVEPKTAIFPGYVAPIAGKAEDGERELVNLNWGFVLLQKGLAPRRVTNVRDDKILISKFWRPLFEQRRCLVPASSYCEPKGVEPAVWHWFAVNSEEERPLFAFPGVWTRYRGPLKKNRENVDQEVFDCMTNTEHPPREDAGTDQIRRISERGSRMRSSWLAATLPGRCASCSSVPSVRICSAWRRGASQSVCTQQAYRSIDGRATSI